MTVHRRQLAPADTVWDAIVSLRRASQSPALPSTAQVLRLEVVVRAACDPLDWLSSQPAGERLYWSDRDHDHRTAGLGFAVRRPMQTDLSLLPRGQGVRWFGGMAFNPEQPPTPEWSVFGPGQLILPRLALEQRDGSMTLALHILPGEANCFPMVSEALRTAEVLQSTDQEMEPNQIRWGLSVNAAVSAIERGMLRKVVLSRRARISLLTPPDPFSLLSKLAASQVDTFDFCFELAPGWAFLGCTPERLFARAGTTLFTEALAGTRRRGETPSADQRLAHALLHSRKDREEHQHVVDAIAAELAELCTSLSVPTSPTIHALHRVQHLRTPIAGTLLPDVDDVRLLQALHPTPAVCGQPADQARTFIHAYEPFHRGWYAGPIGWIGDDQAEFAVGIRSALLRGSSLWVCAGAGLVAASEPDAEWSELESKSAQFLALLEQS